MNSLHRSRILLFVVAVAPVVLGAQSGTVKTGADAYKPPPGMCRIWVNDVPPDKQPAPTDCSTALKNKPANGRVLFGESQASSRTGSPPPSRPFAIPLGSASLRSSSTKTRDSTAAQRDSAKAPPKRVVKKPPPSA